MLRAAVEMPPPSADRAAVVAHPLAAWAEETFGLTSEGGRLVRRPTISFADGVAALADATLFPPEQCEAALKAVLEAGNQAQLPSGEPVFAFRLHQFLASGGSVHATVEPPDRRLLSMQGQVYATQTGTIRSASCFRSPSAASAARNTTSSIWCVTARRCGLSRDHPCSMRPVTMRRSSRDISRSNRMACGPMTRTFPITGWTRAAEISGNVIIPIGRGNYSCSGMERSRQGRWQCDRGLAAATAFPALPPMPGIL
jgi:hypothetical protein